MKRGREVEAYWSTNGRAVLSAQDFDGGLNSDGGEQTFLFCGFQLATCQKIAPPADNRRVSLKAYASGESTPFPAT